MALIIATGCGGTRACSQRRAGRRRRDSRRRLSGPYLLERVDDAAVVQLYADGFNELPLKEKTLIWHLYQAAIAGRDIFYDQRYAHNLEMRDVLEAIVTHRGRRRSGDAAATSSATRNCSGSTPDRTTTSPRASSC